MHNSKNYFLLQVTPFLKSGHICRGATINTALTLDELDEFSVYNISVVYYCKQLHKLVSTPVPM